MVRIVEQPAPAAPASPPRISLWGAVPCASVGLFALSLALPALGEVGLGVPDDRGYLILATGWAGILFGQFGWFANGFWVAGLIYLSLRRWKAAAIAAALAVLVAADTFMLYRTGFPSDSGNSHAAAILAGFYVWWASMWVLAAGAILLWRRHRAADGGEGIPSS
jgi:hypothetical protein